MGRRIRIIALGACWMFVAGVWVMVCFHPAFSSARPVQDDAPRPAEFAHERYEALVVDVHDGDTFRVVPRRLRSVRIAGIDAPEINNDPHGKADPIPAEASRKALSDLLHSGRVFIVET